MQGPGQRNGALSHVRVLDLADHKAVYCSKLLADLGADVIRVEPPGGDPTRKIGPFVDDICGPERSLVFLHYNTNKKSITLNLETAEGKKLFKALAERVDVVVESYAPGYLSQLGMGYESLSTINPGLVLTSVTGFGQTGPYKDFKASDLTALAMSGLMYLHGYPDRPPLWAPFFQAYHIGGYYATIGTLAALSGRALTGQGQHVDISLQECCASVTDLANTVYLADGMVLRRKGMHLPMGQGARLFPHENGYIQILIPLRKPAPENPLFQWMAEEGKAGTLLSDEAWRDANYLYSHMEEMYQLVGEWLSGQKRENVFSEGQKRGIEIAPVKSMGETLSDPQLTEREFLVSVDHPELGRTLKYPGAPYRFSQTPWQIRRRAPLVGEHNQDLYVGELGLSREDLVRLRELGVI